MFLTKMRKTLNICPYPIYLDIELKKQGKRFIGSVDTNCSEHFNIEALKSFADGILNTTIISTQKDITYFRQCLISKEQRKHILELKRSYPYEINKIEESEWFLSVLDELEEIIYSLEDCFTCEDILFCDEFVEKYSAAYAYIYVFEKDVIHKFSGLKDLVEREFEASYKLRTYKFYDYVASDYREELKFLEETNYDNDGKSMSFYDCYWWYGILSLIKEIAERKIKDIENGRYSGWGEPRLSWISHGISEEVARTPRSYYDYLVSGEFLYNGKEVIQKEEPDTTKTTPIIMQNTTETFRDLIQLDKDQKDKLLQILHKRITSDTRPSVIGKTLRYCKERKWFFKTPSKEQFEKEFPVGKNWNSISTYFAERHKGCTKGINIEL